MGTSLQLMVRERDGTARPVSLPVTEVLLAGYTGRDRAQVMAHIHELEALGVKPPSRVPSIFVVPPDLLSTESTMRVSGPETSGEVEVYLVPTDGGLLVGVGSDHTDRAHEAVDIDESKRMCPKSISPELWRYDDVRDHWDEIELRSWVTTAEGERRLYQEGRLDGFLAVDDLLAELRAAGHSDLSRRVVFGGTIATHGGFVYGRRFEVELRDPVLGRALTAAYDVVVPGIEVEATPGPEPRAENAKLRGYV